MAALNVLAFAVRSGRVGFVSLYGTQLQDWGISCKAVKSRAEMAGFVQELINDLKPQAVVSEKIPETSRKGTKTKALIAAISETASHNPVLDVSVTRVQSFKSKFEEAQDLITRYPEVAGYLPARKLFFFEREPRGLVIFEALALAERVILGAPDMLAAAMG